MNAPESKLLISDKAIKTIEEALRAPLRSDRPANAAEPCDDTLVAEATAIADIEKLMGELLVARDYLQSEGERVRQVTGRYAHLAKTASASARIISERLGKWHNPEPEFMQAEIPGAVNVMRPPFFDPETYRSDSNQNWRHGCPYDELAAASFPWLQLLTHPEIWTYPGETMRATMDAFLDADRVARLEHLRADRIDLT